MSQISIFIKSYAADFALLYRCLSSLESYNRDLIPVIVSVPPKDLGQANSVLKGFRGVQLLSDERWSDLFNDVTPGYLNQQIIKLNVDRLNLSSAYFVVDSDTVFIKDFWTADLVTKDGLAKLFVEDDSQAKAPFYRGYYAPRRMSLERIRNNLGLTPELPWLECHNSLVLRAETLLAFRDALLRGGIPGASDYESLLQLSPYEFNWYVSFALKMGLEGHVIAKPLVKMWHTGEHFMLDALAGWTFQDLKRDFIAVIPNSSWANQSSSRRFLYTAAALISTFLRSWSKEGLVRSGRKIFSLKNRTISPW